MRTWLAHVPWDLVIYQNAKLCAAKNALHKATSDGYASTMALWEQRHLQQMSLNEAIDLCRRCHRTAPFCFYNGNTFAGVARSLIASVGLDEPEAVVVRSLVGHIVAGVATTEEIDAFRRFSEGLDE